MIIIPDHVVDAFAQRGVDAALAATKLPARAGDIQPTIDAQLDIIIPIFNAAEPTAECLGRVLLHSPKRCTIHLIDDASTDPKIAQLLTWAQSDARVRISRHSENLGYLASVNEVMQTTRSDVILLNSDTEVTAGWYARLQEAADQDRRIGLACPLSDNATLLSVVAPAAVQELGSDKIASLVDSACREAFPEIPVAVGFCMLIRRSLIDTIGVFDPVFGAGYGEEVDYSMRAWQAGFRIIAASHCFVRHHGGGSFGQYPEVERLRRFNTQLVNTRWPGYRRWVQDWWRDSPLRINTERLRRATKPRCKSHILHVVHRMNYLGGTESISRSIAEQAHASNPSTIAAVSTEDLGWTDAVCTYSVEHPNTIQVNRRYRYVNQRLVTLAADLSQPWVERVFARIMQGGGYGLVHFHHLVNWDSLLLPLIAKHMGARVVLSVHDLYFLCPDYAQLKIPGFRSCGKPRAMAGTDCEGCLEARRWARSDVETGALGLYLETRHALVRKILAAADLVTTPSKFSAGRMRGSFGEIVGDKLVVIPHGTDLMPQGRAARDSQVLVAGYFGGTVPHKGFGLICELAQQCSSLPVQFRVHGAVSPHRVPNDLPDNLRLLGKYQPTTMAALLAEMHLVLIPSRVEETYSLILSECWAAGVPVVAANHGAFPERIRHGVDGWLADPYTVNSWQTQIAHLASDRGRAELTAVRDRIVKKPTRRVAAMAQDYLAAYRNLTDTAPPVALQEHQAIRNVRQLDPRSITRVGRQWMPKGKAKQFIVATARNKWAAAQYRVDIPLSFLHQQNHMQAPLIVRTGAQPPPTAMEMMAFGADLLMGHNLISDPALARIAGYRARSIPVIGSLDDLLIDIPEYNSFSRTYPDIQARMKRALSLYDRLIVSTPMLAEFLSGLCSDIVVVPNALPASPWLDTQAVEAHETQGRCRVGWVGAGQHAGDLESFSEVVERTAKQVDWVFFGMCPDRLRGYAREVHGMVPFEQYPAQFHALNIDIGVAPLLDNDFNRCKSNIKLLEYGALGVPVIASDLEPYRNSPALLATDPRDWVEKILACASDPTARAQLGKALRDWVIDGHRMEHRAVLWKQALNLE